jgi:copper transport protein
VIGAGAWIGSLLVLVLAGVPAALALSAGERGSAVALLVNRFSPVALGAATVLVASGAVSAWAHLGSVAALLGTPYGRTLVVKLALVALVAALGAFHWRRARPALGTEDGARRLRRSAAAELAIAALVLLVTAILVATPPPR